MTARLRAQHATSAPAPGVGIGGSLWVREFYERRSHRPAWLGPNGFLSQAFELIGCLRDADLDGLYPSDYRVSEIEAVAAFDFDLWGDRKSAAQLEFMLTNAFLEFSDHLLRGRLESRGANSEWQVGSVKADLAGVLQTALDRHQIRKTLDSLRPQQIAYVQLQEALVVYEGIAASGGWGEIPQVVADVAKKQAVVQRRLRLSGDLPPGGEPGKASMAAAIGRFQGRHGLQASGFMNEKTRAPMNVSASRRADQVRANLERWRWLPHELGSRSVVVRIADFEIDLIEDGQVIESMRAVVGRPYRRTPLFSSYMTHVIFQPTWNIPRRIATEEILPILRRDKGYLRSREILVLDSRGQVRHEPIDWGNLGNDEFNYQLVQAPGPFNPLGRVKFTFPNSFEVAIHDTPQKDLFSESVRTSATVASALRMPRPSPASSCETILHGTGHEVPRRSTPQKRRLFPCVNPSLYMYFTGPSGWMRSARFSSEPTSMILIGSSSRPSLRQERMQLPVDLHTAAPIDQWELPGDRLHVRIVVLS